ncbi:DUF3078 domain-containing protein [Pontibacter sp. Tf4]|uniref:DUF3078 domain-containing protein n=1 Tax=Pontibacter sp. Tf4 TaxID=2761620 RepID=UPI00162524D4|nr:DUF3078 domain-containing protein [Pontibacter sp. Tf4]MBB6613090.1 DUF3078 domain-containing protein [Pontibacter sp. Tf4]
MLKILRYLVAGLLIAIVSLQPVFAQDTLTDSLETAREDWDFGGTGTINFSQVSLSNWAAGGQSSLSVLGIANVFGNYKKGKNTWNNTLGLTYGTIKLQNQRIRKSDDRLELNIKYGRQATSDWFYSAQVNFRSQLTPTYTVSRDTLLSNFLSPASVLASLGMDYKPNDKLSVFISPVTGKFTIVHDQKLADAGAFGVEAAEKDALGNPIPGTGQNFRKEFGGFVNVRYKNEVLKNVVLQSKLDLFSNYLHNPKNIDMNWENQVDLKVNSFLSASIFLHMVYDDDILIKTGQNDDGSDIRQPRLQLKESLGIGLSYKFD